MNDEEIRELRRRFGDDVANWPPPYRQAARQAGEPDAAGKLDALLLDAVQMPTDEQALSRTLAERIRRRDRVGWSLDLSGWLSPAMAGACAVAVLALASASGYAVATSRDDGIDAAALRLAVAGPVVDDLGLDDLFGGDAL